MSKIELSAVPNNKEVYLNDIAVLLVNKHKKKEAYRIKAIQRACNKSLYKKDFGVANFPWIACVFANQLEFDAFCKSNELEVDYDKMRNIMLKGTSYDAVLDSKKSSAKGKFDMQSVSVSNLIDPHIIG